MIETILRDYYARGRGFDVSRVQLGIRQMTGLFALSDSKACQACHRLPARQDRTECNEEVLKVNSSDTIVDVVNFEEFLSQFEKVPTSVRCDFLIADHGMSNRKIIFCDLTCSEAKYVEDNSSIRNGNKRAKAFQQMKRSIETLMDETNSNHSLIAVNLLTYAEKVCLFAWRDYHVSDAPSPAQCGNATANMRAFIHTPSVMSSQLTACNEVVGHFFVFKQVKFPCVYEF